MKLYFDRLIDEIDLTAEGVAVEPKIGGDKAFVPYDDVLGDMIVSVKNVSHVVVYFESWILTGLIETLCTRWRWGLPRNNDRMRNQIDKDRCIIFSDYVHI